MEFDSLSKLFEEEGDGKNEDKGMKMTVCKLWMKGFDDSGLRGYNRWLESQYQFIF